MDRFAAALCLLALSSCLDTPNPDAVVLTRCEGVPGAVIEAEFEVPCAQLEAQVRLAQGLVVEGGWAPKAWEPLLVGGVRFIYRDADFFKCLDAVCAEKDLAYWHGEEWPQATIELARGGGLVLHELLHQAEALRLNSGAQQAHVGWAEDGRAAADMRFRSSSSL